jgi:hypothetical protein
MARGGQLPEWHAEAERRAAAQRRSDLLRSWLAPLLSARLWLAASAAVLLWAVR